ncbi:MAG: hypothetical protein P4L82_11885 [Ancalomicrobiaceae bacterium]|nr:hypothetical protein [Ancalomicrobiaceae bacterium]
MKAFVAIPCYSGEVGALTMISVIHAIEEARVAGIDTVVAIRPGDSMLARARNAMVADFLASDATDLIFWDADIATTPGAFVALLSHDVDVVGGIYRARSDPERYIFRKLPGGSEVTADNGLIEVDGLGTGFLRIRRSAVDRMMAHFPDLVVIERDGRRLPWLFDFERRGNEYYSEDIVFCQRFRESGGRIWADPELPFHHTGQKTFSGCYGAVLGRARAAATPSSDLEAAQSALDDVLAGFGFTAPR